MDSFISLAQAECKKKFGPGALQKKTAEEDAQSFGAGRCVLLLRPLGRSSPVALVSTTTQRARAKVSLRGYRICLTVCGSWWIRWQTHASMT